MFFITQSSIFSWLCLLFIPEMNVADTAGPLKLLATPCHQVQPSTPAVGPKLSRRCPGPGVAVMRGCQWTNPPM